MKQKILLFVTIALLNLVNSNKLQKLTKEEEDELILSKARCSTLSCVHSSALILQKVDLDTKPCDDFYNFACGSYLAEQHTPDEKATVDTLRFMYEQLIEYLLRLFEHPSESTTSQKIHKYAQNFFDSCMDTPKANDDGLDRLRSLFLNFGGWPLIEGEKWIESSFTTPQQLILDMRKYINNATDNIFNTNKDAVDKKIKKFGLVEEKDVDIIVLNEQLTKLISSMITGMGGVLDDSTKKQIEDLINFEKKAAEYQLKFQRFQKIYPQNERKALKEMKKINKYMLYLNFLETNLFASTVKFEDAKIPKDFNEQYVKFINETDKRTLANFVMWRFTQAALSFMDKDTRNLVLSFKKNTYGSEDNEQRWIYCTELVANVAPVAAGSIYIDGYFPVEDKNTADQLVDYIIRAYNDTVLSSEWMDSYVQNATLEIANKMHRFIGYHENMRRSEGYEFYGNLPLYTDHGDFLKTGMTFKIFSTDREYIRALTPKRKEGSLDEDWTKYARPATVNAYYSEKDNSIQFPAGILAIPNFDKNRPPILNFGSIGSIVGHEVTHSFDNLARNVDNWDKESQKKYKERVECVRKQYSSIRVPEIEEYNANVKGNYSHVFLNGTTTNREDIADNGGIKLAYRAWKLYEKEHLESRIRPIGLDSINQEKMFWLAFAQTFCSVDRPENMAKKIEEDSHSLDQFRVNIPLMNMKEFSQSWNCELGSPMNPIQKCAVWNLIMSFKQDLNQHNRSGFGRVGVI
ncbi:hypothetical protein PVAND_004166 [Polypedilum vanderplanki]|uniref:Uncharacterized protein n=1 Tax=Polypedilum vanderplanki TaxID=319348 RepID=A0A9J6BWA6_POLVA|nr:hypothetical protein PVAND_004166 [Polypedilum vanderplanki]